MVGCGLEPALSSGYEEVHRSTRIADQFPTIWGTWLHYDEHGEAVFARQIVTFAEKEPCVLALSKGLGTDGPNSPADVYRFVPEDDLHVPISQVMCLGDGASDMSVISLLNAHGGIALGLYRGERTDSWSAISEMHTGRRVHNLARADFREGAELMRSLRLAVESICKRIALLELGGASNKHRARFMN